MKTKGEFETAKELYGKAIQLNNKDPYPKFELAKLNVITTEEINEDLQDVIVKLSEQRKAYGTKKREDTCSKFWLNGSLIMLFHTVEIL